MWSFKNYILFVPGNLRGLTQNSWDWGPWIYIFKKYPRFLWSEMFSYPAVTVGLVTKSCPTLVTPWSIAHHAPLSMGFPRQEYWSRLPFLSPRNLPKLGVKSMSPTLQVNCFTTEPPGKLTEQYTRVLIPPRIYPDFILLVCSNLRSNKIYAWHLVGMSHYCL